MFLSLYRTVRQRIETVRALNQLLVRADDRLLDDIGLTRQDVRVLRQELPGLLAMRAAEPGGYRPVAA